MAEQPKVVVAGAGDWVQKQYAPALRPYHLRGECRVYIIYDTGFASRATNLMPQQIQQSNQTTLSHVREFEQWGASCLDLNNPTHREQIQHMSPYVVFIVTPDNTHCHEAATWLDRATNIIIEKPFDVDPEPIRKLRLSLEEPGVIAQVFGFDHYLVRANQFMQTREYLRFNQHLERQIHEFRFHMLESTTTRDESDLVARAPSLQEGMIMDMGSHAPAMVMPFGNPNTIQLDFVKAGVYSANPARGITTSGSDLIKSGMETFAEIQFNFTSVFDQRVNATARVGKCVGEEDEKYVEVIGGQNRDRRITLDLKNYIVDFTTGPTLQPVTSLFPNPVYLLIREVMAGRHADSLALFGPEEGENIIARLGEWRRPVIDYVRGHTSRLPEYRAKTPLTDILTQLQPL